MKKLTWFLLFLPLHLCAQNFSGLWAGYIEVAGNDIPYELLIYQENGGLTGYAMTTMSIKGVDNIGIKSVKFKLKKNTLTIEDDELIFNNYNTPPKRVILSGNLHFDTDGPLKEMNGPYRTRSLDFRDKNYYSGKILIRKQDEPYSSLLMAKLGEMKLLEQESIASSKNNKQDIAVTDTRSLPGQEVNPSTEQKPSITTPPVNNPEQPVAKAKVEENKHVAVAAHKPESKSEKRPAQFLAERKKTEVIQTIFYTGDSITITVYDNGVVDGDTVTLLVNEKIILPTVLLTTKPVRTVIATSSVDSLQLILYAENLGAYPPNTGLLVIQDGKLRTEIRFTGDLQKSASIILRRKKL